MNSPATFTAAEIAKALALKRQAVNWHLRSVAPAGIKLVRGNETAAWQLSQLPTALLEKLSTAAAQQHCRTVETFLTMPRDRWQPALALEDICDADIQAADKLRAALQPWLIRQHDGRLASMELEAGGVESYRRIFGNAITPRYWRQLFTRTIQRDRGFEDWNRLEIYLPDRPKQKAALAALVSAALAADFSGLENYLRSLFFTDRPDRDVRAGTWILALKTYQEFVAGGESEKSAGRRVRQFLVARAPFLAASRDALWIAWQRKLDALEKAKGNLESLRDGRADNGAEVAISQADIDRLTHSAVLKNGGRIDAAWREEYPRLSAATRQRYADSFTAPAKIHQLLNRTKIDALTARHQGPRKLRRLCGTVQRDWTGIPSMHSWVVDDLTANLECAIKNRDGSTSLLQPQIIAVMDSASRKFVGWTISNAKAPNAGIVCDAVLEGMKVHGVPKNLGVENGFVFGKSLLVNGKDDELGRTLVVGLGQYGCKVDHFEKMNPQSKAELEYAFHQLQCLMERHPGYTGRLQMLDAPEEFKREQRLIRAGKIDAIQARYTSDEFIVVTNQLILQYNATPQQGRLKGLSPNECFEASLDLNNPPIQFVPKLEWMLNERQLVLVGASGVSFTHRSTQQAVKVRGGELVKYIGQELWAVMDRQDASLVTFMDEDFSLTFTMEVCARPSAREADFAPGSGTLAKERAKIRAHERAISEEYRRLKNGFGDPRRGLLAAIRPAGESELAESAPTPHRLTLMPRNLLEAGQQMEAQRAAITQAKDNKKRQRRQTQAIASRTGMIIPENAPEVPADDLRSLADFLSEKETL